MSREIILFGVGSRAEKFMVMHFDEIEICEFWDNQKSDSFLGYPIKTPYKGKKAFIIVTVDGWFCYSMIRSQLLELGYIEFENFIPHTIYNKRVALAYGNCHMEAVRKFLESNKQFSEKYGFYPFPGICDLTREFNYREIMSHVDLFLHQAIRRDNCYGERLASDYLINNLSKECKIIAIPNLYGLPKCFFPQLEMENQKKSKMHPYFFMDKNIIMWLKEGKTVEEIISSIAGGIYSEKEIMNMWLEFKEKLLFREEEWDIKISDYIFDNYQKEKLFCDRNHITAKLAREIANRILKYIGIYSEIVLYPVGMDAMETFIYPDVKKALGLQFEEKIIRQFSLGASCSGYEMDFEEYIEQICSYTLLVLRDEEE